MRCFRRQPSRRLRQQSENGQQLALASVPVRVVPTPEFYGMSGRYFDGLREARANRQAYEPDVRRPLWQLSEELTGVRAPARRTRSPGSRSEVTTA